RDCHVTGVQTCALPIYQRGAFQHESRRPGHPPRACPAAAICGRLHRMTLSEFPDDWQTALCVAAHPDDLEYGTAAVVAGWTAAEIGRASGRERVESADG